MNGGGSNGSLSQYKIVWWILSIVMTGFLTVSGTIYLNLNNAVEQNRLALNTIKEAQQVYRERIVALETQAAANRDNIGDIRYSIEYIKKRVDETLNKNPGRMP